MGLEHNCLEPVKQLGVCNSPYLLRQSALKELLLKPFSIKMNISTVNSGSGPDIADL